MATSLDHEYWMRHACMLALRGTGHVSPNPRVGAVIVRDGNIVAEGWHQVYGGPHAEAHALASFDGITDDTIMYVTLEPCSHVGKQPACTGAIRASGIRTVVVGMPDPNPAVSGGGTELLRTHGIDVITDVSRTECEWINRFFTTWVMQQRTYVIAKIATTLDGHAIAATHDGRWITSAKSRERVHALRAEVDCVLTGIGTVRSDDPMLTVRAVPGRNPARAIVDTHCMLPSSSAIARSASEIPTYIFCSSDSSTSDRANALRALGCIVEATPMHDNRIDLHQVMRQLASYQITSIMLEAGPTLTSSFLRDDLIDEFEIHTGTGTGNDSITWSESCIQPPADMFALHHQLLCDGDSHRVYTRIHV